MKCPEAADPAPGVLCPLLPNSSGITGLASPAGLRGPLDLCWGFRCRYSTELWSPVEFSSTDTCPGALWREAICHSEHRLLPMGEMSGLHGGLTVGGICDRPRDSVSIGMAGPGPES